MRLSVKTSRARVLTAAACVALCGSVLAVGSSPAHAATEAPARSAAVTAPLPKVYPVTVDNPGPQVTDPLSTPVSLQITAHDADPLQLLVFSAAGLPPGLSIDPASGLISGTITAAYTGDVAVTATDETTGRLGTATFHWTAGSKVTVKAPAVERSWVGVPVDVKVTATDSGAAKVTYSAKGLPAFRSM